MIASSLSFSLGSLVFSLIFSLLFVVLFNPLFLFPPLLLPSAMDSWVRVSLNTINDGRFFVPVLEPDGFVSLEVYSEHKGQLRVSVVDVRDHNRRGIFSPFLFPLLSSFLCFLSPLPSPLSPPPPVTVMWVPIEMEPSSYEDKNNPSKDFIKQKNC